MQPRPTSLPGATALVLATLSVGALRPSCAAAQEPVPAPAVDSAADPAADSAPPVRVVEVVPGPRYDAGPLRRALVGDNHRTLWLRPLRVPVLDLGSFAGGLEPDHEGGNQSRTLHLTAPDGRTWIFRSTDKYLDRVLPEDLRGTWLHDLAQDHISVFHPTAGLVVPELNEALGLLAVPAVLRVMPDDPRLGEHRETFAGMLGLMVERPNEGEGDRPLYGGFSKIVGTDEVLEKLEEHPRNRVDAREFLAARLVDFLVGDTDRGPDQWRWAREPEPGGFRWRPITRDRDWAFLRADGLLASGARSVFPKLVTFDRSLPDLDALTFAERELGRRLLTALDRDAWEAVVREVHAGLTDPVIDRAVALLPAEHRRDQGGQLAATLKARREQLPAAAAAYYEWLAGEVDVRATDLADRAEIVRHADGTVAVTLLSPASDLAPVLAGTEAAGAEEREGPRPVRAADGPDPRSGVPAVDGPGDAAGAEPARAPEAGDAADAAGPSSGVDWAPYYQRTFRPGETREVRVYLRDGDDTAVVRGAGGEAIAVRVIGGGGQDILRDAGSGGTTVLYDDDPDTRFLAGRDTRVDPRPYEEPEAPEGFFAYQLERVRDWGRETAWFNPALDYREGAGVIVGGGPTWTRYGFRRTPYASKLSVKGLLGTASGGVGVEAVAETRFEASPLGLRLRARVSGLEGVRYYGLGNDTERLPSDDAWIPQDRVLIQPSLSVRGSRWWSEVGPVFRWTDAAVPPGNPLADGGGGEGPQMGAPASSSLAELGVRAEARYRHVDHDNVPTRGFELSAAVAGFPVAGRGATHAGAEAEVRGYLPLPLNSVLALRSGARRAWGDPPLHDLAWVGGRTTLRGFRWQRFAGDGAVYGGAELRVPLFRANLGLARGRLGVLGLADAGRVYLEGESPEGWHAGYGAGLWFATLDTAVNLVWARGESDRLYAGIGLPF